LKVEWFLAMGSSLSQPTFPAGVWFDDAFLERAEHVGRVAEPRLFSMHEAKVAAANSLSERQADRIRQRVADAERARTASLTRDADERLAADRTQLELARSAAAEQTKRETLKLEFDARHRAALTDPRNAPVQMVPLLPFSSWKPLRSASVSAASPSTPTVTGVVATAVTTAAAVAAAVAPSTESSQAETAAADPALLAEVATLRARVAEIDQLRARVEQMTVVEQGRALARSAARETELQLASLVSSWRVATSVAQGNEEKIAALEKTVSSAEAAVAAASSWRQRADAQCVGARGELLTQLQQTGNSDAEIARLVRKYADCVQRGD
jgi:hypothetical protein